MLNLRVLIYRNYFPSLVWNKTLSSGFHLNGIQRVLNYDFNRHIRTKTDRGIVQYHQQRSINDMASNVARQTWLVKSYQMYSTGVPKEKKIHPKTIKNVKNAVSSKLESKSLRLQKITILDKSVTKPDVSISTAFPVQIQSPQIHNIVPIIDISPQQTNVLRKDPQKPTIQKHYSKLSQAVMDETELQPVTLQKESQHTILKKDSKINIPPSETRTVTLKSETQSSTKSESKSEEMKTSPQPTVETDFQDTNWIGSRCSPQINCVDLSLVALPVSLHQREDSLLVQNFNQIYYMVLNANYILYAQLTQQKGRQLYETAEQTLSDPKTYQEFQRQVTLTTRSIANTVSVSLAKKVGEPAELKEKIANAVEKAAENAKQMGNTVSDKMKEFLAPLKEKVDKFRKNN